MVASAINLIML